MLLTLLQFFATKFLFLALHLESGCFPRPLTAREEAAAFSALRAGDAAAREKLIRHNLRLVAHIVKKYYALPGDQEDLVSIGTIGLIKGISTFKPDRNVRLATYASRCIENEILMFLRRNNKVKYEVSIDEPLNVDWDGNELLLSDILGTDEDVISKGLEDEVDRRLLRQALGLLSERERSIIELRFGIDRKDGKEFTQKEVADMMGISQSYISRLEKKIMKRLKKEILRMQQV